MLQPIFTMSNEDWVPTPYKGKINGNDNIGFGYNITAHLRHGYSLDYFSSPNYLSDLKSFCNTFGLEYSVGSKSPFTITPVEGVYLYFDALAEELKAFKANAKQRKYIGSVNDSSSNFYNLLFNTDYSVFWTVNAQALVGAVLNSTHEVASFLDLLYNMGGYELSLFNTFLGYLFSGDYESAVSDLRGTEYYNTPFLRERADRNVSLILSSDSEANSLVESWTSGFAAQYPIFPQIIEKISLSLNGQ